VTLRTRPGAIATTVELRDVVFGYGPQRRLLAGLSSRFESGRMTVITGRSGSGKSTLLRLIAGLERVDSGELTIDGRPLARLDREEVAALRRRVIGYMPQEPATVGFLSVLENILLALQIRGVPFEEGLPRARALLSALGLSQRIDQRVSRLSAGETQRVALARALASGQGLLVLDEPTSRLDETNGQLAAEVLARARDDGQTIICASHDQWLISRADEVMTMA
jgi:putative ABC transport system ATP-binding protein